MRLAPTPTAETALATLNMALIDKGMFADAVCCLTSWDMSCGIELVLTDSGSAYFAHIFHDAVTAIHATIEHPPVGYAPFRGHLERLFGTLHTGLVSRFTGRTFDNTVTLAGYPAAERASLTVEDVCWAFVRYIVDCYHNQKHDGLGGETPRNAWKRLVQRYKTVPLPGKDAIRNIFGIRHRGMLDIRGVRVLNAYYNSLPLQEYRRTVGDRQVDVLIDRNDLGWISVVIHDACLTVPSITPGLIGVSVDDWLATRADLRRRFGEQAEIVEPTVLRTSRRDSGDERRRRSARQHRLDHADVQATRRCGAPSDDRVVASAGVGG